MRAKTWEARELSWSFDNRSSGGGEKGDPRKPSRSGTKSGS